MIYSALIPIAQFFYVGVDYVYAFPRTVAEYGKLEIYDVRHYGELTAISFIRERQ